MKAESLTGVDWLKDLSKLGLLGSAGADHYEGAACTSDAPLARDLGRITVESAAIGDRMHPASGPIILLQEEHLASLMVAVQTGMKEDLLLADDPLILVDTTAEL